MTKLQITGKVDSLARGHERNRFKNSVGDGSSRKQIPRKELVQRVRGELLICNCLKHGERNAYDGRKGDSKEGSPDW